MWLFNEASLLPINGKLIPVICDCGWPMKCRSVIMIKLLLIGTIAFNFYELADATYFIRVSTNSRLTKSTQSSHFWSILWSIEFLGSHRSWVPCGVYVLDRNAPTVSKIADRLRSRSRTRNHRISRSCTSERCWISSIRIFWFTSDGEVLSSILDP